MTIKPGDIGIGDADGVRIVPREFAYQLLIRAEEIYENEKLIFGWVQEGQSVDEITDNGSIFNRLNVN